MFVTWSCSSCTFTNHGRLIFSSILGLRMISIRLKREAYRLLEQKQLVWVIDVKHIQGLKPNSSTFKMIPQSSAYEMLTLRICLDPVPSVCTWNIGIHLIQGQTQVGLPKIHFLFWDGFLTRSYSGFRSVHRISIVEIIIKRSILEHVFLGLLTFGCGSRAFRVYFSMEPT